jgi:ferredoxin
MFRSKKLTDLARGQDCLFNIPGVCNYNAETTVAAHSNLLRHGKGKGLKAHDCYSAWACSNCHSWLDQGQASRADKEAAFMAAFERQVLEWANMGVLSVK